MEELIRQAGLLVQLVEWAGPIFAAYGYWIIGGAVALERSILIGLVVPGEVMLAAGGIYAGHGRLNIVAVVAIGAVAAIIGESLGFALGRRYGLSIVRRLPFAGKLEERVEEIRPHFERRGGLTVAVGRYATAAGAFIPFTAGMGRMPYRRFIAWDVPAIVVWAIAISLVGFFFGRNLELVERILSRFGWAMLALFVLGIGGRIAWKKHQERSGSKKKKKKKS